MYILYFILLFCATILVFYAVLPLLSMLLAALVGARPGNKLRVLPQSDFACIITAYGDASIAVNQVYSILAQSYTNYHIYMVGDNCHEQPAFPTHEKLTLLYPEKSLHSKLKSIKLAIDSFVRNHTTVLILDADNLLHPDALKHFDNLVGEGYKAIQGQRTAKNMDTPIAAIDALSELYYNVSQRWAPFRIGSSATIAGSGMAIEAFFFKTYVNKLLDGEDKLILAEDKLLQMMLVESGIQIAYCREALIFDEKVREGAQVQRQRTRWLRSWFDHWGEALMIAFGGLSKASWNRFYFGLMLSVPPMVLHIAAMLLFSLLGLLFYWPLFWLSLAGIVLFTVGFIYALLVAPAPAAVWKAIPFIPLFAIRQVMAILKIKASNKDFMTTTHTQMLTIQDVWEQRKHDFPYVKNS